MRRYVPVVIAGLALFAAACRDTAAPANEPTALTNLGDQSYSIVVGPSNDANSQSLAFEIPAGGGFKRVGEFLLQFDANSVCDPATSGYGTEYWKKDCQTLSSDFPITARFFTSDGKSHVEFKPDIRFHPAKNVTISVIRKEIVGKRLTLPLVLKYGIWYWTQVGDTRFFIDEAFYDRELRTKFDTESGRVWRRIRHFSGIVIHVGYCTEYPDDPSCAGGGME
jgi:hypothetical protein